MTDLILSDDALSRLLPLHLRVTPAGRIASAGATLRKLIGDAAEFDAVFRSTRAGVLPSDGRLVLPPDGRVFLALIAHSDLVLRGNGVVLPSGEILLNLGFGIALSDAVGRFSLTDRDFAGADLAMEMLFLHEANGAMLSELSRSNLRLEEARRAAEVQAFTDPLTGLYNRRGLEISLDLALENGAGGGGFAVIQMDLDLFKAVNDSHGHAAGDEVLRRVADRLRHATRAHDTVARMGGDEFVLILPGLVDRDLLMAFGKRVISGIEAPVQVGTAACRISASLGIAVSSDYADPDAETVLADADRALYAAKAAGRGRVCIGEVGSLAHANGQGGTHRAGAR